MGKVLGGATVVLFVGVLVAGIARLVVGWRGGAWQVAWQAVSVAFTLLLLMYMSSGGADRVLELTGPQRPSVAAMVGRVGAVLLTLAAAANVRRPAFSGRLSYG